MPGRPLAKVARLIANPTSAEVLEALCADRELTVSGLARELGIPRSTVSESVTALVAAGLLRRRVEGRTAIVRLASSDVGEALEALGRLEEAPAPVGLRAVMRMQALRRARTCYDHLAGEVGVRLADRLQARGCSRRIRTAHGACPPPAATS
jgi:DNA-binding transcriptional ArsR family regulator